MITISLNGSYETAISFVLNNFTSYTLLCLRFPFNFALISETGFTKNNQYFLAENISFFKTLFSFSGEQVLDVFFHGAVGFCGSFFDFSV